jgi:hypothetical protein
MTTPLEEMERQWRELPASEELERWCVYLKRCYAVHLGRLSKTPEAGARQAALRRLFLRVARTEFLPLKETLVAAVDRFDEENLKRFILRLGAEMKSKNWGWGKRWIYDDVDAAILKLWDGFDIFPAKRELVRLRSLPPLSRWNSTAASKCISFYANVGVLPKTYAMRLSRLELKPEKPAYILDAKFQRSPREFSVDFSPSGEVWWLSQNPQKKVQKMWDEKSAANPFTAADVKEVQARARPRKGKPAKTPRRSAAALVDTRAGKRS